MKIIFLGKDGQLGRSIFKLINLKKRNKKNLISDFTFIGREELSMDSLDDIEKYFDKNRYDILVNCSAYTAVDKAEEEKEIANQINHLAVKKLAEIAYKNNCNLIHISTDYVFDGKNKKSYNESDETNPINIYGESKLAGEKAIQDTMENNATIIRTSWVYSEFGNNFLKTMLKLGKKLEEIEVIKDQIGSPTYASDLAQMILNILETKYSKKIDSKTEIYHFTNEGEISWHEFSIEIFKLAKIDCKTKPIESKYYKTKAKRPRNSVMSKKKIQQDFNINLVPWKHSLKKAIEVLQGNNCK